jgi:ACS family hexuronate transporter-like MFS transporter
MSSPTTGQYPKTSRSDTAPSRSRWIAISIFLLCNALNFLDRQLLAAVAPTIKAVFHVSNVQYGTLISVFSIVYAVATPISGWLVDVTGLNAAAFLFVSIWSLASMATAFATSFGGLLACRASLGLGESAALPLLSKANATYLSPSEWGLASAAGSIAVTIGSISAPLVAGFTSAAYNWRAGFVLSGALGLVWVAIWMIAARRFYNSGFHPTAAHSGAPQASKSRVIRDLRLWRIIVAYPLVLTVFMLWMNWTTLFLVQQFHFSQTDANRYFAWLPPVFVALGGFVNGVLTFYWIRRGANGFSARWRVCVICAPAFVLAAATPFLPSATMAIAGICMTMFVCQSVVGSLNIMPIDLFGTGHAAFTISLLACSYSLLQVFLSPLIGFTVDHFGFAPVCVITSLLPLVGISLLRGVSNERL